MNSISESTLSVAICDQFAFYPFRELVVGGLSSWEEIDQAEQFIRTVLLHDYLELDGEPMPSPGDEDEWTPEEVVAGGRNVITAFLPILDDYKEIIHLQTGPTPELQIELPPRLLQVAARSAGTDRPDDPYLRSHLRYLQNLSIVLRRGGSALMVGDVGRAAIQTSREMPASLLHNLDRDIAEFAEQANRGELGLVVPPLLATVIQRAGSRDRIVQTVVALREEWTEPRRAIWEILHPLRRTRDLKEAQDLMRQLNDVSQAIRAPGAEGTWPTEVLWEVTTEGGAAAFAAWTSAGNPVLGAALPATARAVARVGSLGRRLFGLGGFSLARAITREVQRYQPSVDLLRTLISDDERTRLGL
jgi:hypothetical protein